MYEVTGDPEPPAEARQKLLSDARAARDVYAQERTRAENQLLAAKQLVTALTRQLRIADEKLTSVEDFIGEVRVRMRMRGLQTYPKPPPPIPRLASAKKPTDNSPPCMSPFSETL